jgi:serine/threonine-protein kinase
MVTRRLGRYHLVDAIGVGPMGEVHRARVYGVAGFERQFAVKRFHPEVVANPNIAARLSGAARAYGGLEHPRIARLFEYGVAGGETFTACELVPGMDLAQLAAAASQPLPAGAAFTLIASAARAVGYAHGRGILHLGLAPTNIIATPDGDVKVTDVGILAPRLPPRPSDDPALANRIGYLAPEQLIGEATSAATDVFAFGVLTFELVTGQRAFPGATTLDVEQAILSAQPREPALPKPLLRVLQRCWARSPFERFPDARALADAIDAALRLAPVPGGKREVAALVRESLARIEAIREQQLSGAMALPGGPPVRRSAGKVIVPTSDSAQRSGLNPRPSAPIAVRVPEIAAVPARVPELPRAPRSSQPLPTAIVPPPVAPPVASPSPTSSGPSAPSAPPIGPRAARPSQGLARTGTDSTDEVTIARSPLDDALSTLGHDDGDVTPPPAAVPLDAVVSRAPGGTLSAVRRKDDELPRATTDSGPTAVREAMGTAPPAPRDSSSDLARSLTFSDALEPELVYELEEQSRPGTDGELVFAPTAPAASPPPIPVAPPPLPEPRKTPSGLGQVEAPIAVDAPIARPKRSRGALWAALGIVVVGGGVATVLWQPWQAKATDGLAAAPRDAPLVTSAEPGAPVDATPAPGRDAAAIAAATRDAGPGPTSARPADAGAPTIADAGAPPIADAAAPPLPRANDQRPDDSFAISSTPTGAAVFLDGAEQGKTPLTITAAADKHTLAIVKPGFDLFLQEVDGRHPITANLVEVTPTGGPAGIKVKCTKKDRYYVFVDGHGTGMLCPTERIHVDLGNHVVEVYDLVTDARTQYPVLVKDTRNSLRVKLD